MMKKTNNNVVIITGSSKGIGASTAKRFAQHGYAIVINYLHDQAKAQQTYDEIRSLGVACLLIQADVTTEFGVMQLFEAADKLGRVKVLVNNVGILQAQMPLTSITLDRFKTVLATNVLSCFLCIKEAAKRMSTYHGGVGGSIVNVSSLASKTGAPFEYVDYAASKGAIDSLTRGAAIELSSQGIRVNGVRPALIDTDIHSLGGEPNRIERLKTKIPLQRGGTPEEVAAAIFWLASEQASFVTGTFIDVSGGL